MTILHDYEQMPPLYRFIYNKVRFYSGKDIHKFETKDQSIRDIGYLFLLLTKINMK